MACDEHGVDVAMNGKQWEMSWRLGSTMGKVHDGWATKHGSLYSRNMYGECILNTLLKVNITSIMMYDFYDPVATIATSFFRS